ncbi:MAG: hypothetical protein DRI24_24645 [Deltaproteobacteria bacterium]|nr:MAG: hypothetical protein DRI24_24645 [Deltaproteobacteria bacterium]
MTRGICKNRVGERYGSVTVTSRAPNDRSNNARWLVKCDCGNEVTLLANNLKRTKFCGKGCELYTAHKRNDVTGQRFGRLIAVEAVGKKGRHTEWFFNCDCGNEYKGVSTHVISGSVKSCGCLGIQSRIKHGKSHTREYKTERYQAYTNAKRRATPTGVQDREVLEIYKNARNLTKETGVLHEVDHKIPLQGEFVSGLHVAANLQILTRHQNRKKSRSYEI